MNSCIFPFLVWLLVTFEIIFLFGKDQINVTDRPRRSARIWSDTEATGSTRELFSGETYDYTGEYRIVRFYNSNGFHNDWNWNDVTLVTHASLDNLHLLSKLVQHWQGLISISLFVPDLDASAADAAVKKIKYCDSLISKYVSFHLVYPADIPADVSRSSQIFDDLSCDQFQQELVNVPSYNKQGKICPRARLN